MLSERVNKVDLFIEVRDARWPFISHNVLLDELIPPHKKRIVIYNKADLAYPKSTSKYLQYTKEVEKYEWFEMSARRHVNIDKFISYVKNSVNPQFKTIGNWMMIGGIPNVGKSTIINSLRKKEEDIDSSKRRSGAQVGAVPWITRSITGFKVMLEPLTYLIDTPGIIQPKILHNEDGLRLWAIGSIRDGIVDHEIVVDYILYMLNKKGIKTYWDFYGLSSPTEKLDVILNKLKEKYGRNSKHNAYIAFLNDFREGNLGKITFDASPEEEIERRKNIIKEIKRLKREKENKSDDSDEEKAA